MHVGPGGIGLLTASATSRLASTSRVAAALAPSRDSATATRIPAAPVLSPGLAAYQGGGQKPATPPPPAPVRDPVAEAAAFFAAQREAAARPAPSPTAAAVPRSPVMPAPAYAEPARPSFTPPAAAVEPAPAALAPALPLGLQGEPPALPRGAEPAADLQKTPVSASIDVPSELWIGLGILGAAVVLGGVFLATRHLQPERRSAPRRRPFSAAP